MKTVVMPPRQSGDDTDGNNQRDAVADAALRNLFAEPHHKRGASRQGEDYQKVPPEVWVRHHLFCLSSDLPRIPQNDANRYPLNETQDNCAIAGVLRNLLPAIGLLREFLQGRHDDSEELHDD